MSRFALVPVEAAPEMVEATRGAFREWHGEDAKGVYDAMLALSPGNAILAEILAARDCLIEAEMLHDGYPSHIVTMLMATLDKLGPAGEVEG